jgi:hypothetical protein
LGKQQVARVTSFYRNSGDFMKHADLSWRQFETLVETAFNEALDPTRWRVAQQWRKQYGDREGNIISVRMDIHVAERRQGGCGFVVDAKHFRVNWLPPHEIDSTVNYKRLCRASRAIIIASDVTKIHENTAAYAREKGVILFRANQKIRYNLRQLFDSFVSAQATNYFGSAPRHMIRPKITP